MRKVVLTLLGATAIGISHASETAAQSATAGSNAGLHSSKGQFTSVPRLKRPKAGAVQPKSDLRFEQMRDPCTVEG
jgi:hypothetical protein